MPNAANHYATPPTISVTWHRVRILSAESVAPERDNRRRVGVVRVEVVRQTHDEVVRRVP